MAEKDIQGYRRSHKRIPTSVALDDDQAELSARQAAIGQLGGKLKGEKPKRKLLKDYSQFGMSNAKHMSTDPTYGPESDPNDPTYDAETARAAVDEAAAEASQPVDPDGFKMNKDWKDLLGGTYGGYPEIPVEEPSKIRQDLENWLDSQWDEDEKEKRIARQRASQEAMVRAQMGAGEAGRSGAAALLQGEAGRLAESQARVAEMERELELTGLQSWLMGFDLQKEQYDQGEREQAAQAALLGLEVYDLDYDDMWELFQLPENAKSEAARKLHNKAWKQMQEDGHYDEEDDEPEDVANIFVPEWAEGTEVDLLEGETAAEWDERVRLLYLAAKVPAEWITSWRMSNFLPVDDMYAFKSSGIFDTREDGIIIPRNSAFDPVEQGWVDTGDTITVTNSRGEEIVHNKYKSGDLVIYIPA